MKDPGKAFPRRSLKMVASKDHYKEFALTSSTEQVVLPKCCRPLPNKKLKSIQLTKVDAIETAPAFVS